MSSEANSFPTLPIIDLLDMEMATAEQTANLINQARRFLASVHASISSRYDEGNYVVVGERLNLLANVLPSSSINNETLEPAAYESDVANAIVVPKLPPLLT